MGMGNKASAQPTYPQPNSCCIYRSANSSHNRRVQPGRNAFYEITSKILAACCAAPSPAQWHVTSSAPCDRSNGSAKTSALTNQLKLPRVSPSCPEILISALGGKADIA